MRIDVYGAKAAQDKNFRFSNRPERKYPPVPKTSGVESTKEDQIMNYNKKPDFQLALFMIAFLFVTAIGIITYKQPEQVQAYYETGSNYITNTNDKVKIIVESTKRNLENSINEFLKENIIINIDYEYCNGIIGGNYQVLIHYREKK